MAKATILGKAVWHGEIVNQCRCKTCGRGFLAGGNHYWHNHYYCSTACGTEANKCYECGDNRHRCECKYACARCGDNRNFCRCMF